jgi:hypothetical protein
MSLPTMSLPALSLANALSGLLVPVVLGLIAWHLTGVRRREESPDEAEQRRRAWVAWEVRGMVVAVAGPCAAGIFFGYLRVEYTLPLLLFIAAGFLAAGLITPAEQRARR